MQTAQLVRPEYRMSISGISMIPKEPSTHGMVGVEQLVQRCRGSWPRTWRTDIARARWDQILVGRSLLITELVGSTLSWTGRAG